MDHEASRRNWFFRVSPSDAKRRGRRGSRAVQPIAALPDNTRPQSRLLAEVDGVGGDWSRGYP